MSNFMNSRRRDFPRTRPRWWPMMMVLALFAALTQRTFSPCGFELPETMTATQQAAATSASVAPFHAEQTGHRHDSDAETVQKGSKHGSKSDADCCVSADESALLSATVQATVPVVAQLTIEYSNVSVASPLRLLHLKSGSLYGRAGPDSFRLSRALCRSSLFNRPPPISV